MGIEIMITGVSHITLAVKDIGESGATCQQLAEPNSSETV